MKSICILAIGLVLVILVAGCVSSSNSQSNADRLYSQGKYVEAIKGYENEMINNPTPTYISYAWAQIGLSNHNLGLENEAVSAYTSSISHNPNQAYVWYDLGLSLSNLNRPQDALDAFEKSIELNPNFVVAWVMRGNSLGELGRYKEAIASYDRALNLDPNDKLAYENKQIAARKLALNSSTNFNS